MYRRCGKCQLHATAAAVSQIAISDRCIDVNTRANLSLCMRHIRIHSASLIPLFFNLSVKWPTFLCTHSPTLALNLPSDSLVTFTKPVTPTLQPHCTGLHATWLRRSWLQKKRTLSNEKRNESKNVNIIREKSAVYVIISHASCTGTCNSFRPIVRLLNISFYGYDMNGREMAFPFGSGDGDGDRGSGAERCYVQSN